MLRHFQSAPYKWTDGYLGQAWLQSARLLTSKLAKTGSQILLM